MTRKKVVRQCGISSYEPGTPSVNQFKKQEAITICDQVIKQFPQSEGAQKCFTLRSEILERKLAIVAEKYIPVKNNSFLKINYKNIDSLFFSAYRISEEFNSRFFETINDSTTLAELSQLSPDTTWQVKLTNLNDYQEHSTEVVMPGLPSGRYLLFARTNKNSTDFRHDVFSYATLQSTNLVLIESSYLGKQRLQVVDRTTGRPIPDCKVTLTNSDARNASTINEILTSGKDGFINDIPLSVDYARNVKTSVNHGKDNAVFENYYFHRYYEPTRKDDRISARAFLFTDRSIYRPGQTVYFKGILIKIKNGKSSVVTDQYVEVLLEDVNGDEAGLLRLKTNQFGSFAGEFKLPVTGITGEYTLSVDEDTEGESKFYDDLDQFQYSSVEISVEEYKRPTFEVSFIPVREAVKVNDTVTVKGKAIAFNNARLSGAKVAYEVIREVRYPQWYYWESKYNSSDEEEIISGEVTTNDKGEFEIRFAAEPDEEVLPEDKPVFNYKVSVDVTDINGETRSGATHVKVGYHSLIATITAPTVLDKAVSENSISIATDNLNGEPVLAKGTIQIYKIKFPDFPVRPRPWNNPDLPLLSENQFNKLFPHDIYEQDKRTEKVRKGKLMTTVNFNTEITKVIKFQLDPSWELGEYLIELTTSDPDGNPISDLYRFKLIDAKSKGIADQALFLVELNKTSYKPGEVARLKIGSASQDITVTLDFERMHEVYQTRVEYLSNNSKEIRIPITEAMGNGFSVHYSGVNYNSFFKGTKQIPVVVEKEKIEIETITFKDKLQPGEKQTWSFEIVDSDPSKKEAEVLASMYDASLDQFKPHEWSFNPIPDSYYHSYNRTSADNSFGDVDFKVRNRNASYYFYPKQYFDELDWYGLALTNKYYVRQQYIDRLYSSGAISVPSFINQSTKRGLKKGYVIGTVKNADGSPIPGVNVVIKGTTVGTSTDMNGNYLLVADKDDQLVFSFIGYSSIEGTVGRKNVLDVVLEEDIKQLSEVVVTGYGVQMKKNLSASSISTVMSDSTKSDYILKPIVTLSETLQGRVAGVQITGIPGGTSKIVIRGASTLNGDAEPMYIVDGVPVAASSISQDDLASIEILKGTAATALYGSSAGNGVVIITTKAGQKKLDEELAKVHVRKNFNETAFFFPQLRTDENGRIRFTFTTPESLTRWKLQLLAHNKQLVSASKTIQAITQKELMVMPNAPRFLRIGDEIIFSTRISNLTATLKQGIVALQLSNALTGEPVDQLFENRTRNQSFNVAGNGNTEVSWRLKIPSGIDAVQYKVIAKAGNFSDGEQNALPVLSSRMLVTETMPMYIRSGETKTFTLENLKNNKSSSLQNHLLTLEVTSNPVWYALQSLPYLMEFPHECAEQTFARVYANSLAASVAHSNPKIKEVFDKWSSSGELVSALEKNAELKSTILEETPWLRDAQSESEQKKRIALLFDMQTMKSQLKMATEKLQQLQLSSGGFTWFKGGHYPSRYITQHVASGFGHLKYLKIAIDNEAKEIYEDAVSYLDEQIADDYNHLLDQANSILLKAENKTTGVKLSKEFLERKTIQNDQIHYMYMRSFYSDIPLPEKCKPAMEYYQKQSIQYWEQVNLYMKGMIALIQYRNENITVANAILKTLRETSISSDEMGMYWKENSGGYYWNEAPIEIQALLIEAFAEIEGGDSSIAAEDKRKTIDELKIWLLKNKQVSQWKTTKATTEAVYALLLNGTKWLEQENLLDVSVGNKKATPGSLQTAPEAGTGYFKTSWKGQMISSSMSDVKLTKKDAGIAWAGLYWQYFEDLDKITPAETPLKLFKKVFVVTKTDGAEVLKEINSATAIKVGDLLRVRIELRADRYMEFLQMKDMRASGLEPVDVLSEYKYQENLGYYQSTRDASTSFFFDRVEKGVYVFEYDLRANNKGDFANGITTIQSMYAPEFSSHSEGVRIKID